MRDGKEDDYIMVLAVMGAALAAFIHAWVLYKVFS